MDNQVIHLYGASGSGTSTIGKFISMELGCFFMDTDDYFWEATDPPFQIKRRAPDRIALMRKDLAKYGKAVISGSLVDWGDELIPLFTLAVRVETDPGIRIDRLRKRERERFGDRIDAGGDLYKRHQKFIEWAASYDTGGLDMRSKAKHDAWQKQLQCRMILLDGSRPVEENYEIIRQNLYAEDGKSAGYEELHPGLCEKQH